MQRRGHGCEAVAGSEALKSSTVPDHGPTAEQKSLLHQLGLSLPERVKSLSKCSADSAIA